MGPQCIFISKTIFFPKQGILAVGDLHLGHKSGMMKKGISLPENEAEEIVGEFEDIFIEIKKQNFKLKKIIFLGDIKHSFGFEWNEKSSFNLLYNFLLKEIGKENIIFIRGNHDTIDFSYGEMREFYFENGVAFIHGHKDLPKEIKKKTKTIVMGHLHPSVILSDKQNVKREKYKCFLTGIYKKINYLILPSFSGISEGTPINELSNFYDDNFSIIPKKILKNFGIRIVGKDKVYNFGKIAELL